MSTEKPPDALNKPQQKQIYCWFIQKYLNHDKSCTSKSKLEIIANNNMMADNLKKTKNMQNLFLM